MSHSYQTSDALQELPAAAPSESTRHGASRHMTFALKAPTRVRASSAEARLTGLYHGSEIEPKRKLEQATPHDNVKAILDGYAHYNRGDGEPSLAHWHEDAEYRTAPEDPDSAVHRGLDAIKHLFASWREVYPDLRVEVREVKAHRNLVFAWVRFAGRGAVSGIPIHMELAHVCTMHEGKTACLVEYTDRTVALGAIGLAE